MVLLIIALIIIGFMFPPAWLALIGLGIYLVASRKSRRSDAVENRVKKMVSAGKDYAVFADLYFEAARSYAVEKGAKAPEQNVASAHIVVDGRTYFVVFTRAASGGTAIGVEDADAVRRRIFDKPMEDFINNSKNVTAGKDTMSNTFDVGGFSFSGDASDDKVAAKVISKIARRVVELSPTELDLYRYLIEEADRMSEGGGIGKLALEKSGIKPLEYEGEMAKAHNYSNNRVALDYLNDEVSPDLKEALGEDRADNVRANIFTYVADLNATVVCEIRKKYAVHYANNCTQNGHFGFADKWDDVIQSIP